MVAVQDFPTLPGIGWPVTRTPIWKTMIQEAISGKETRMPMYSFPRYQYTLTAPVLRDGVAYQELQTLFGFFNSVAGSGQIFYYNDPNDNTVNNATFGIGNGVAKNFALVRNYGGYTEPVQTPGGVNIYVNGVHALDTTYSLQFPGTIVFLSAPANGAVLTWSGTFVWTCRFDNDKTEFSQDMSGFWSVKKISFTTIKAA